MGYNRLRKVDGPLGRCDEAADAALGDQLKSYFDAIVAGPVPDNLIKLADALDQAFDRGELKCCAQGPPARIR